MTVKPPLGDPRLFRYDGSGRTPAFFNVAGAARATAAATRDLIASLREAAAAHGAGIIRVCLHGSRDESLQDMIVLAAASAYARPHRHPGKEEAYHAIEGAAALVVFGDDGSVRETTRLGSAHALGARLGANRYHALVPLTPEFVFRETRSGPLRDGDTEFAPWAPDGRNPDEASAHTRALLESIHGVP